MFNFFRSAFGLCAILSASLLGSVGLDAQARETQPSTVIAFSTKPSPVLLGQNRFHVSLTGQGSSISGADVTVLLVMPAMPEIKHPEMRTEVNLKDLGKGQYEGVGLVTMAGKWNVLVTARRQGKLLAEKKLTLTTK